MKAAEKNLTIAIPVLNEENLIANTIESVYKIAEETLDNYEILILDDGSTDQTYNVIQRVISHYGDHVQVFRKEQNEGVGAAFHFILKKAKFPFITLIPGDNAYKPNGIKRLFQEVGTVPLIISYREAMDKRRTKLRFILSKIATTYLTFLTGKRIRDAHSLYVFPVNITRSLKVRNASYGYHMEFLSRLLRKVDRFKVIPVELTPNPDANSGVMRFRVLIGCGITMLKLIGLRLINKL